MPQDFGMNLAVPSQANIVLQSRRCVCTVRAENNVERCTLILAREDSVADPSARPKTSGPSGLMRHDSADAVLSVGEGP